MCVILYIPAGKTIKKQYVKNAIENNPDGAGIMYYNTAGKVSIKKGFFSFGELWKFYKKLKNDYPIAIHCRIATSGKVSEKTCHPFEISKDFETMKKSQSVCSIGAFMHNGIINWCTPDNGMKSDVSDTMVFNKNVLYDSIPILDNTAILNLLDNLGSRLLIFLNDKRVKLFGNWIQDKSGFFASNESYKKEKIKYYAPLYSYGLNDNYYAGTYQNTETLLCYEIAAPISKKTEQNFDNLFSFIPEVIDCTAMKQKDKKYYFSLWCYDLIDDYLPNDWQVVNWYEDIETTKAYNKYINESETKHRGGLKP